VTATTELPIEGALPDLDGATRWLNCPKNAVLRASVKPAASQLGNQMIRDNTLTTSTAPNTSISSALVDKSCFVSNASISGARAPERGLMGSPLLFRGLSKAEPGVASALLEYLEHPLAPG
jgi:hypothetical protein